MTASSSSATPIGRRSIVKAGAWGLPVVAIAANLPAGAAPSGPCTPFDVGLTWNSTSYTRTSNSAAKYVASFTNPVTNSPDSITVTLTSVLIGNTKYGNEGSGANAGNLVGDNLKLSGTAIGGTGQQGITLHQNLPATTTNMRDNRQELTSTFDQPVYDLEFGISDIDSASGDFFDSVDFSSPATWTATVGSTIVGAGLSGNPWRTTGANLPVDNDSGIGNANIQIAGPVATFTIFYWDRRGTTGSGIDNDQKIFITNLKFKVSGCDQPTSPKVAPRRETTPVQETPPIPETTPVQGTFPNPASSLN